MARVLLIQPHEDLTKEYKRSRINTPINLIIIGTAIEDSTRLRFMIEILI